MGIDEQTIEEMASHLAIQRILSAYADAVNRRAWGELSELFLEDATIEVTPLQRPPLVLAGPGRGAAAGSHRLRAGDHRRDQQVPAGRRRADRGS